MFPTAIGPDGFIGEFYLMLNSSVTVTFTEAFHS